jgi:hypothetical protein
VLDVQHVDAKDGPHSDHRADLTRLSPVHAALRERITLNPKSEI